MSRQDDQVGFAPGKSSWKCSKGGSVVMTTEFNYSHGTIVKHFIRKPAHRVWGDTRALDSREDRIAETMRTVCSKNQEYCDQIEDKSYPE